MVQVIRHPAAQASPSRVVMVTGGSGLVGHGLQRVVEKCIQPHEQWVFLGLSDGDLRSETETKQLFVTHKPTHVIHLAARVGGLFANMHSNVEFFHDNMSMNTNVLRYCHEFKVDRVISCLSTCIFPDEVTYPISEDMLHQGPPHPSNQGYAFAKRMLEVLTRLYRDQYGCRYSCVIPTNVYGPHDNFNVATGHVIPGLMMKCLAAKKSGGDFVIYGSGKPLRQFIFSEDLARLIHWCLDNYDSPLPLILSPSEHDEVSIADVAHTLAEVMGFEGRVVFDSSRADGQYRKCASNARLRSLWPEFQFTPMRDALRVTASWLQENYEAARK